MISNTITTAIATPPMFLTISVSVKWSAPEASGLAATSCNSIKKPRKILVRIVTVNPSKRFYLIDSKQRSRDDPRLPRRHDKCSPQLLRYEVVLDHSGNFNWLPRKLGWGESRLTRSTYSSPL